MTQSLTRDLTEQLTQGLTKQLEESLTQSLTEEITQQVDSKAQALEQALEQELSEQVGDATEDTLKYGGAVAYAELPADAPVGSMYKMAEDDAGHDLAAGEVVFWDGESWVPLGSRANVSDCIKKEDVSIATAAQIDALFSQGGD